jgi:hypothetical protein
MPPCKTPLDGGPPRRRTKGRAVSDKDKRLLLIALGAGLIVGGHRLMDAELGKLGAPHLVGAILLTIALGE